MRQYLFLMIALLAVGSAGCSSDSTENDIIENNNIVSDSIKNDSIKNDSIRNDSIRNNRGESDGNKTDSVKANTANLFVGKWKLVSIEDGGTVSDYTGDNSTFCFYEDGRYAYTPYIDKNIEGAVIGIYESSVSLLDYNYSYTEEELFIHNVSGGLKYIHSYTFSEDNQTLRIVLKRTVLDGDVYYFVMPEPSPLTGKTQVLKKVLN